VALVRERTIPTERPPLVGEVSANFADRGVSHGQCGGSPTAVISVFYTSKTFLHHFMFHHTNLVYAQASGFGATPTDGRVVAQAATRRLHIAAPRFRARVRSCAICDGQSDRGTGILRVIRFRLPIHNPPTAPHSSPFIMVGTIGQQRPTYQFDSVSPQPKKLKKTLTDAGTPFRLAF
jgi:hypothetical protein